MVTIRMMAQSEAKEVKALAQKTFGSIMRLLIPTPEIGIVAVDGDKIVGGTMLQYIITKDVKIGDINIAFVTPDYQGQGIGKQLYEQSVAYLWSQGCTAVSSNARDDNPGSWQLFLDNNMKKTSLVEGVRILGFKAMFLQYFKTSLPYSNGYEFYLDAKDKEITPKAGSSAKYISLYILLNILIISLSLFTTKENFVPFFGAYSALMIGQVLFGYIGTLFSKDKWRFRTNTGGGALSMLISLLGGFFPLVGNWYPKAYKKNKQFKKDMGLVSLCEWLFFIVAIVASYVLIDKSVFFAYVSNLGVAMLLYRAIGFFPFEPFGGHRIFTWNKSLFAVTSAISVALIAYTHFL